MDGNHLGITSKRLTKVHQTEDLDSQSMMQKSWVFPLTDKEFSVEHGGRSMKSRVANILLPLS